MTPKGFSDQCVEIREAVLAGHISVGQAVAALKSLQLQLNLAVTQLAYQKMDHNKELLFRMHLLDGQAKSPLLMSRNHRVLVPAHIARLMSPDDRKANGMKHLRKRPIATALRLSAIFTTSSAPGFTGTGLKTITTAIQCAGRRSKRAFLTSGYRKTAKYYL